MRLRTLLLLFVCTVLGGGAWGAASVAAPAPPLPPATGPVLYLFAHQDDEVFVLGKMRREMAGDREVHALWITDGARDGRAAQREKESRDVMALIGVPAARLHFLRFPDHFSVRHLGEIYDQVAAVVRARPFTEIVTPAYEGGNIDHDVAALMGALAAELAPASPQHLEYSLYNRYQRRQHYGTFLPNAPGPVMVEKLDPDRRELVLRALRLYRSQRVLLTVLAIVGHKKAILERGELFRVAPRYDFLRRPVDEPCGYEVAHLRRVHFGYWLRQVEPFLAAHPPEDPRAGRSPQGGQDDPGQHPEHGG